VIFGKKDLAPLLDPAPPPDWILQEIEAAGIRLRFDSILVATQQVMFLDVYPLNSLESIRVTPAE
jgi:hypothetical protein